MVPGSFGFATFVFAAMTMLAPSTAARRAIAFPMPRLAPVMKSVLLESVPILSSSSVQVARGQRGAAEHAGNDARRHPKVRGGGQRAPIARRLTSRGV